MTKDFRLRQDWRERKASKIGKADSGIFEQVILRIIPLIGGEVIQMVASSDIDSLISIEDDDFMYG